MVKCATRKLEHSTHGSLAEAISRQDEAKLEEDEAKLGEEVGKEG